MRIFQHMCDSGGSERPFPITPNAQNVSMGEEGVHSHITQTPGYEKTAIHVWD